LTETLTRLMAVSLAPVGFNSFLHGIVLHFSTSFALSHCNY